MLLGALAIGTAVASEREQSSQTEVLERECARYGLERKEVRAAQAGEESANRGEKPRWWDVLVTANDGRWRLARTDHDLYLDDHEGPTTVDPVRGRDARSGLRYKLVMSFRDRLIATLRAARPLFEVEGVVVAGSEVPNLLESGAASTLVVSQDVDIAVPIHRHADVKARLSRLEGLAPSPEEPSVWLPTESDRIELNFIGFDPSESDPSAVRVLEDDVLPLMVFGPLSFLRPGREIDLGDGLRVPVPRNAGLLMEKLVTDRSGVKGDRDLLVALALVLVAEPDDVAELVTIYQSLSRELQAAVQSNLATLSLLPPIEGMPDPTTERGRVATLLARLHGER